MIIKRLKVHSSPSLQFLDQKIGLENSCLELNENFNFPPLDYNKYI